MIAISATEAKQSFGSILERVEQQESFMVYRHNKPVARIVPVGIPTEGSSTFGVLSEYADSSKRRLESEAFSRAMEEKHAGR